MTPTTIPIFRSFDEAKMREFYIDFLGFDLVWEHRFDPDAPLYCEMRRDNCVLHISEHHGDATPGSRVRVYVDDIDRLHSALVAKAYKFARPGIQNQPYGTREVSVADPFGNSLVFYTFLDQVASG